jgi:hypothetical protein
MPSQPLPFPDKGRVEALLRAGIPLSLLCDLACSDPHSQELYAVERAPLAGTAVS